jgi:hypothetical protein
MSSRLRSWSKVEVTLQLTVSQSVCLGIEHPCGTCDQILLPVGRLLSESCCFVSVGRPLWREDGSAVCSAITEWSESLRTRNHTLLSHLRLPELGGPGSRIYIPQEQGGPVIPPGTGLCLGIWGLRSHYDWRSASQYVLASSPPWDLRPDINFAVLPLLGALSDERSSVSCQSLSAIIVHRQVWFLFFCLSPLHFTRHTFYVYTIYARPSQLRLITADHAPSFVAYTTTAI